MPPEDKDEPRRHPPTRPERIDEGTRRDDLNRKHRYHEPRPIPQPPSPPDKDGGKKP